MFFKNMRVITGIARGRKLLTPEGDSIRPTSSKVKESVFSIIQFEIEGSIVLDLFAGSGQMGIEALSRGASEVVFVENSKAAQNLIRQNLKNTKLTDNAKVISGDVKTFVSNMTYNPDIAFLDPPYRQGGLEDILSVLVNKMKKHGAIICEIASDCNLPQEIGDFKIKKEYVYGLAKLVLYRVPEDEAV